MDDHAVRRIVIVGGGTAGWMMAAAAGHILNDGRRRITLVESDAIGTVGVGEATIPPILRFNQQLGIDEAEFLRATGATYKLGIEFVGWGDGQEPYIHPFGRIGRDLEMIRFHQLWLWLRDEPGVGRFDDYAIGALLARQGRFGKPGADPRSPLTTTAHAYHFDASLYAAFLRRRAEAAGVRRLEGRVAEVTRDAATGHVSHVVLADGRTIEGDLFIDCSGFRSLLLGDAMGVPFRDWSHWLPCDRAIAMPSASLSPLPSSTRATTRPAGWQWRIPLQHRTGNGHVYCSAFSDDTAAEDELVAGLESESTGAPNRLRFTTGVRESLWVGNVVALGLAAGFLEPLESTSIHLVQIGIETLLALFPDRRHAVAERAAYNRSMRAHYEGTRDFLIAHYMLAGRSDTPFWRHVRAIAPPDRLAERLELFRVKGRLFTAGDDLFRIDSWAAVLIGQGVLPAEHDPLLDSLDADALADVLRTIAADYARFADRQAPHRDALVRAMSRPADASFRV